MAIAPQYVSTDFPQTAFVPGGSLPTVVPGGIYVTDQPTLDALTNAAAAAGVSLVFSATGSGAVAGMNYQPNTNLQLPSYAQPANSQWWMSDAIDDLEVPQGPGSRYNVLVPTLSWEQNAVQEASVWYANNVWNMIYTGGYANVQLGWATAPHPLGPWTKQGVVVGSTTAGLTAGGFHSNVYVEGSMLYLYVVDAAHTNTLVLLTANILDPTTWTRNRTYALPDTTNMSVWGNTFIYKEADASYTLFFESMYQGSFRMSVATLGSSPNGNIVSYTAPLPSLEPIGNAADGLASASGGWYGKTADGRYIAYYHGASRGNLPTEIYRAYSTDKINWTIDNNAYPILTRESVYDVDQVADAFLVSTAAGVWYMFFEGVDNTNVGFTIQAVPLKPSLVVQDGTRKVRIPFEGNTTGAITRPQKDKVSRLAANFATASSSWTDVFETQYPFFPRGKTIKASFTGLFSVTGGSNSVWGWRMIVRDSGNNVVATQNLGCTGMPSTGVQYPTMVETAFDGLNPHERYYVKLQTIAYGGASLQCRPVAYPNNEFLSITVGDAQGMYG